MKIPILLLLMICSVFSVCSQELHKELEKGDWMVVVKNTKSLNENYKLAAKTLLSNGFPIKNSDAELGYINTEIFTSHDPIGGAHYQRLLLYIEDSHIKISSHSAVMNTNERLQYPKFYQDVFQKKVANHYGLFQVLISLADLMGGEVFFSK